jgi:polyisoprenyl-phosphate glycosyltransferase
MQPEKRRSALQNKQVFISCVVPVFNEEAVIENFLNHLFTILSQLTTHFEVIVVDDGSTDQTVEKVRAFSRRIPLKVLGLSRNFGKEVALTAGLENASGDVTI